jgi:putative ABC transport system substrate-binding protein
MALQRPDWEHPPRSGRGGWAARRRAFAVALVLVSLGLLIEGTGAAERGRPYLIGALTESWGPTPPIVGLRNGLQERGYQENVHFVIGVRFTQGNTAALPAAARELIQHGVDIIFAPLEGPAKAAQMPTDWIPIVFSGVGDPVGSGSVQSFARPRGNITGVTDLHLELGPKRLEVFLETIPGVRRILFPSDANDAHSVAAAKLYQDAAHHLKIELVQKAVQTREEARATLAQVRRGEVDGILAPGVLSLNIHGIVLEATTQRAIPTMFAGAFWVERGGLASYGADYYESGQQAARLVDKILKGANPAETPVEVNPRIELAINLQVAKTLGVTIAPEVLYQADRLVR